MRSGRRVFSGWVARAGRARLGAARDDRGAQLLEVALVLPLLLVLAVGILDFGTAYNLRQILNNAAREGARIGAAQPSSDVNCGSNCLPAPGSVQAVYKDVLTYLQNARVDTTFIGSSPSYTSASSTWTYPCAAKTCGPVSNALTIQRAYIVIDPNSGKHIITTHVTFSYPYNWVYGFNRIISIFGAKYGGTIAITTDALIQNQ